jgi:hypothetical protein
MEPNSNTNESWEDKYLALLDKHNQLTEQHGQLEYEYSENTIVQSMNDMKKI